MLLAYGLPIAVALGLWWFLTGAILWLDGLPSRTHPWTLAAATLVLAAALAGLAATRDDTGVFGAYAAFVSAVLAWGWIETTFLLGMLTGPRRAPCPTGVRGVRRAAAAIGAILHHDLAILVGVVVVGTIASGANPVGLATIVVLAAMRFSAQLNLFLGVPNRAEEFLPDRLRYLASYFADRRMNFLFPVSVTASTAVAASLVRGGLDPAASAGDVTGATLLATLLGLAILEHWLMVLPLNAAALWKWGLRSRRGDAPLPAFAPPRPPLVPSSGEL